MTNITIPFDTRAKIQTAASLRIPVAEQFPEALLVATAADPFAAPFARRIQELAAGAGARPLVILLTSPAGTLLPEPARAELCAALAAVTAVVTGLDEAQWRTLPAERLVREQSGDETRLERLIDHVHGRHALSAPPA